MPSRKKKTDKPPRTWGIDDLMPVHGKYYRTRLMTVATINPDYVQWWIDKKGVRITSDLRNILINAKLYYQ